ncbi:hypothetical protein ACHAXR_009919 [Thalassiosira sp. AJA248-18]
MMKSPTTTPARWSWKAMLLAAAAVASGGSSASAAGSMTSYAGQFHQKFNAAAAFVIQKPSSSSSSLTHERRKCKKSHSHYYFIPHHPFLKDGIIALATTSLTTAPSFSASAADDDILSDPPSPSPENAATAATTDQPLLSESDAIRILRAYPRYYSNDKRRQQVAMSNPGEKMKACHTALDVLYLFSQVSTTLPPTINNNVDAITPTSLLTNMSKEQLLSIIEPIVDDISPNIAAAALRRLSSPPFLPSSFPTTTSRNSRHNYYSNSKNKLMSNVSALERSVYDQLMQLLLKKLSDAMENQLDNLVASSSTIAQHDNHSPMLLLPHRDSWITPPTTPPSSKSSTTSDGRSNNNNVLNWYALADLLFSLSSLCNVLSNRNKGGNIIKGHLLTNISPREQGSIVNIFDSAIDYLSWDNKMASSFVRCIGPRRLVRDVVQPLVAMTMTRKKVCSRREGVEGWGYTAEEKGGDDQFPFTMPKDGRGSCDQLMAILSQYLANPNSLEKLSASDLSITLWSMATIYHPLNGQQQEQQPLKLQLPQRVLLRTYMKRLRKYSVRSPARGKDLVQAVSSVARLIGYLEEHDRALLQTQRTASSQVLPLPIRLPGEEDGSGSYSFSLGKDTVSDAILSQPPFIPIPPMEEPTTKSPADASRDPAYVSTKTLHKEAVIMFHTLVNEIIHPPYFSKDKKGNVVKNGNEEDCVEDIKLQSLSIGQIADILQAASSLNIAHDDITVAVAKILKYLSSDPSSPRSPLRQCRRCKDISRLLLSLQRLRVGTGIFDDTVDTTGDVDASLGDSISHGIIEEDDTHNHNGGLEKQCVQLLGERFLDMVLWHEKQQSTWACCDAKTLTVILRSGVLMFQGNSTATKAMFDAASILILDHASVGEDNEDWESSSFLMTCNEFEVSNYLFAFAIAKRFDKGVFISLTDQMAEEDILESCTPSSASRAMWSCAMLLSLDEASNHGAKQNEFTPGSFSGESFLHERQVDLFHTLAPLLLFTPLSPTDTSCAMWAMAKAEYVIDRGLFDQLASSLASEDMLELSNTRLISQALWSCGKMVEFEVPTFSAEAQTNSDGDCVSASDGDTGKSDSDSEMFSPPPYVKCVDKYIRFLITNQAQMTPKHLSQSIWAIGRLRLSDSSLIQDMIDIALCRCEQLNAREIANIVWGLSKVHGKPEVIRTMIQRLSTSPNLTKECTAQEAANMLFALGKLQIRDQEAFASLSSILRNRLHEANSQAIANALWAYEVVDITPPPELLSTWAQDRLGMLTYKSDPSRNLQ